METENSIPFKERSRSVFHYLKAFAKSPIQTIKETPKDWDWVTTLAVQFSIAGPIGFLSGLFEGSTLGMIFNIFIHPIFIILLSLLISLFSKIVIRFLYQLEFQLLDIYRVVALATLPWAVIKILAPLNIPIGIVGMLIACVLISVGYVENFRLPRKGILKLMSIVFGLFFISWMINIISTTHKNEAIKNEVTKESLDILEKELGK